jgi:acetyl-CoA carboxylase, carboxyl transferase, beta subunit
MLRKGLFKKPNNTLEDTELIGAAIAPNVPDALYFKCPNCRTSVLKEDMAMEVCPKCGFHFRIGARRRIALLCDENSFEEMDADFVSGNPIAFLGYEKKLKEAKEKSGENEAVICGKATISGNPVCLFVMEADFMMGSMGSVVGEKITRLFECALKEQLPVLGVTVSGGARMQEGILSLMQMAKTSGAVKWHSDAGLLYIALLTDPTTGGVTASFAMEADIIMTEPGALIAFAGPRVIEQTIKQKLPQGFQRAEFLLENGFVDCIVKRAAQRETIGRILALHRREKTNERN